MAYSVCLLTMVAMQPADRQIWPPLPGTSSTLWMGMPTGMSCGGVQTHTWGTTRVQRSAVADVSTAVPHVGHKGLDILYSTNRASLQQHVHVCQPRIPDTVQHTTHPQHATYLEWHGVSWPNCSLWPRHDRVTWAEALGGKDVAAGRLLAGLHCVLCVHACGHVHGREGRDGKGVAEERGECMKRHGVLGV